MGLMVILSTYLKVLSFENYFGVVSEATDNIHKIQG